MEQQGLFALQLVHLEVVEGSGEEAAVEVAVVVVEVGTGQFLALVQGDAQDGDWPP